MLMNTYSRLPVAFVEGKGTYLYDDNGKEYLDFVAGIAVNCLGHCHPRLVEALTEQANTLWHTSNLYHLPVQQELAQKLIDESGMSSVFLSNSGTESVEGALKIAKKYGKIVHQGTKTQIIAMHNSFHGRTIGALSVTGRSKYQKDFTPLLPNVQFANYNDIEDVVSKITKETAAIIMELIQGEGGINEADVDFVKQIREICDKEDILLIIDEVQTGIGRTGKMFCFQHYGITPDIVTLAKGLGGGFPVGAVLASKKVAELLQPGDHASTFGGNPLACKVASTVIDVINDQEILANVEEMGAYFNKKVDELIKKYPIVKKYKGKGLMVGIEVEADTVQIMKQCLEKGLLILMAGEGIVRMLPPLNVTKNEIDQAIEIIDEVLSTM